MLRAQYEKEGDYVGIQTKFNYAWVRIQQGALGNLSLHFMLTSCLDLIRA